MRYSGKRLEASRTAEWVAAARSVGGLLPSELALARDPYGVLYARGLVRGVAELLLRHPRWARALLPHAGPLTSFLLWMQLRTRALDDLLLEFVRGGGRQIVLLGAGYDSRALRFGHELAGAQVFEVDHPATQAGKVERLPAETFRTRVVYVGWDFERDDMAELPLRLHRQGLDPNARVLTIWEGVTMYLGHAAIEATLQAVRAFAGDRSLLAFTYIDRRALARPGHELKLSARLVASVGEPWRFGWEPAELPAWLVARGYALLSDESDADLAARHLPPRMRRSFARASRRVALAEVRCVGTDQS